MWCQRSVQQVSFFLLKVKSFWMFLYKQQRLCLTKKTLCMAFSILEKYCRFSSIFLSSTHFPLSSITRVFVMDICAILNSSLVSSIQQLLARRYKKASQSFPYSGVKGMGRDILSVWPHVDFQSLQRWVHGQKPEDSCCLKYDRAPLSNTLESANGRCKMGDRWKALNGLFCLFFNQVWGFTHWTTLLRIFFL